MNAGSHQGKCRTQDPFQKQQRCWTGKICGGKNCGEPGLIRKNEQENPSHRGRSGSIWATTPHLSEKRNFLIPALQDSNSAMGQ